MFIFYPKRILKCLKTVTVAERSKYFYSKPDSGRINMSDCSTSFLLWMNEHVVLAEKWFSSMNDKPSVTMGPCAVFL